MRCVSELQIGKCTEESGHGVIEGNVRVIVYPLQERKTFPTY